MARGVQDLGFRLLGTEGTVTYFSKAGLEIESIPQLAPGETRLLDLILDGEVDLVVNTLLLGASYEDGASIRRAVTEKTSPSSPPPRRPWLLSMVFGP